MTKELFYRMDCDLATAETNGNFVDCVVAYNDEVVVLLIVETNVAITMI